MIGLLNKEFNISSDSIAVSYSELSQLKLTIKTFIISLATYFAWFLSSIFYIKSRHQAIDTMVDNSMVLTNNTISINSTDYQRTNSQHKHIFFVTDRNRLVKNSLLTGFGRHRGNKLSYGLSTISLPNNHKRGRLELPKKLHFEFKAETAKHFKQVEIQDSDKNNFYSSINQSLQRNKDKRLLIYIHGFNVKFDESLMQLAQVSHDINFDGVPISYSWPSQGGCHALKYVIDSNNANWSESHFKAFLLDLLANTEAEKISIIAHSLGGKILSRVLQELERTNKSKLFDQIILAAPDVDAELFSEQMLKVNQIANQITLYTSAQDKALALSEKVHLYQRAGQSTDKILILPSINTIDVKLLKSSHSYFSNEIIDDIQKVILQGLLPKQRGLTNIKLQYAQFWQL